MTPEGIIIGLLASLCVALIVAVIARRERLGELVGEIKTLERDNAQLREKLKKEDENFKDALNRLAEYYDERVKRAQKEVDQANRTVENAHDTALRLKANLQIWSEARKVVDQWLEQWDKPQSSWSDFAKLVDRPKPTDES